MAAADPIASAMLAAIKAGGGDLAELAPGFAGELAELPHYAVPRGYGAGLPFVPPSVQTVDTKAAGETVALFAAALTLSQGCVLTREQLGAFILAHAYGTTALANGGFVPWVEAGKTGTPPSYPESSVLVYGGDPGLAIVAPWRAGSSKLDAHSTRTLRQCRSYARILAHARIFTATPNAGETYLSDITGAFPTPTAPPGIMAPSPAALPILAASLFTAAVVGAIGLSQYFKADVAKAKIHADADNAAGLAGIAAALSLELERLRLVAETGKAIDPSPLATKIADGLDAKIQQKPEGPGGALRIVGGIVGGLTLGAVAGYYAKHYGIGAKA